MSGTPEDRSEMDFMLGMLDKFQGQANALFCADEVFCGRAPHRGTETCAVVEAMASLEFACVSFFSLISSFFHMLLLPMIHLCSIDFATTAYTVQY
jgi:hypothetical protein